MLTIAIVMTVVMHILVTCMCFYLWNMVKKTNPSNLPKAFYVLTGCRMVSMLVVFVVGLILLKGDTESIKLFAVIAVAAYLLMLVVDTTYFYCSSQLPNNNKNV